MAYDNSAPADTGSEILTELDKVRKNWDALSTTIGEDHEVMGAVKDGKHKKITLPWLAADPTRVDDTGFFYSKDDGDGNTEAYFMDSANPARVSQMTKAGQSYGAPASWCLFDNTGANVSAFNATASKTGTGQYRITFDVASPMSGTDYLVLVTCIGATNTASFASYASPLTTRVEIYTYTLTPATNTIALANAVGNVSVAIYDL